MTVGVDSTRDAQGKEPMQSPRRDPPHGEHRLIPFWVPDYITRDVVVRAIRSCACTPIALLDLWDAPACSGSCNGLICDLSPWTEREIARFERVNETCDSFAFLLPVPMGKEGVARRLHAGNKMVRWVVFDRSAEGEEQLCDAVRWLANRQTCAGLLDYVVSLLPPLDDLSMGFVRWSVFGITVRRSAPVVRASRALNTTPRTLSRRLSDNTLPPPNELHRWLKLMAVSWRAHRSDTKLGKVAKYFDLTSMELYHLKRGLLSPSQRRALGKAVSALPFVEGAFRARCAELGRIKMKGFTDQSRDARWLTQG